MCIQSVLPKWRKEVHKDCGTEIKYLGNDHCLKPFCPQCNTLVTKREIAIE